MLNRELEQTLNEAFKEARSKRHEFMTVEHLLLALLDNDAASTVLQACGADIVKLRKDLDDFVDSTTPLIPESNGEQETQPTLGFQRVLQRAVFHVQSSGKTEVSGANVLVAIFSEQESQAVYFLKQQNIANNMLYVLLEECLDFYRFLQKDERYATAFKNICGIKYNAKTKLANMIAQSVFGKTKQTYAYAKVLMNGYKEEIGTEGNQSMLQWLSENNGINGVIRDGGSDSKAQQKH